MKKTNVYPCLKGLIAIDIETSGPDVFENYFAKFGKKVSDYYELERLDPSYRVVYSKEEQVDIPALVYNRY